MTPERWREIERLYHEAIERDRAAGDRAAFLEEACAGDEALRREVESLLDHHAQAKDFIEVPAVEAHLPLLPRALRAARSFHESVPSGQLVGRALGVYQLNAFIGAGGMGAVYRAVDTRLNRTVAIKVLPDHVSDVPERRERFKREAKIVSSLNHPHICALYDVGTENGIDYLVMEHVDGETLQHRLAQGPLPPGRALEYAIQICDALDKAHRRGVVHRDLKPANIMLTKSGVKLLDFGAATFGTPAVGIVSEGHSGERPEGLTAEGVILGTLQYLSPEQLEGKQADARSDIFAFGAVVYEMIAGTRAFVGASQASIVGSILKDDPPPIAEVVRETPLALARAISRCLAKDPDDRWQTANDLLFELRSIESATGSIASATSPQRSLRRWAERAAWTAALLAGIVAAFVWAQRGSVRPGPIRVSIPLPKDVSLWAIGRGSSVAVSPDGQRVVFVGVVGGRTQLYVRRLDGDDSIPIAGTEGGTNPFFSPDGLWIGFTVGAPAGAVKKVPVQGGAVMTVTDGFAVQGAAWGPDDTIVFAATNPKAAGLWRIASSGGTPRRVTTRSQGEAWPQILPDGKAVLYTMWNHTGFDGGRIAVQSLEGGEPAILVERASYGRVVPLDSRRAYLVYARPEGLLGVPFDLDQRRVAGRAMPVQDDVFTNMSGGAHFSFSADGLLAYIPGKINELEKTLLWVGPDGRATEIATIPGFSSVYRLSPDGRRVVRPSGFGSNRDLWVDDLEGRGAPMRLTWGGVQNAPAWTPDGKRIIYSSGGANGNLFWRAADGTGDEERLTTSPNSQMTGSVSPDGTTLAYVDIHPARGADIWLLSLRKPYEPRLFLGTPSGELSPMFSPDGRWLAYQSRMSGQFEVYLASLSAGGRQIAVSKGGGWRPLWSPDGRELYYRDVDPTQGGNMMAVSIDTTRAEPRIGAPRVLFASPYQGEGDIAADGRFLLLKRTPQESPSRVIELVFNWFDDLQAKVPQQ